MLSICSEPGGREVIEGSGTEKGHYLTYFYQDPSSFCAENRL